MRCIFALVLAVLLVCSGCSQQAVFQREIFCMDTVMSLKIWGQDGEAALDQCQAALYELQNTWSATSASSLLGRMNAGEEVSLTQEQTALLSRVEALSMRTGGAFDPRLGSLCEAWGFYGQNYRVPTQETLAQAMDEEAWDLGAAIKGYAGQQMVDILDQMNVQCAILNLGGNVQTYGDKADGSPWQVAVQNPDGSGAYLGILSVTGTCSVVTSGDYQRYFEENGERYHHILNPQTGYPADSGLSSVTVICRDGLTADALSTALFVLGLEDGAALWRESDDFEAVFVLRDGSIYATEGAALSGCEYEVITR